MIITQTKISRLTVWTLIASMTVGIGAVCARSLEIHQDFLQSNSPFYVRVSVGNHGGCPEDLTCPASTYRLRLSTTAGEITLAKEILIGSDETLDNPLHDTGLPSPEMQMAFTSQFYKGAIIKLFPSSDATLEDILLIEMTKNDSDAQTFEIPFRLLSPDSMSILKTSVRVDQRWAAWESEAEQLQVQVLFTGLESKAIAKNFRNKLEVVNRLLGLERVAREALLMGRITNLTYTELQGLWAITWNNLLFSNNDVFIFAHRYQRLKNRYNKSLTTLPLVVGNLNVLLQNIRYRHQLAE